MGIFALLVVAGPSRAAFAQDAWNFTSEIPCATAPVYGVPFTQCWASNVRTFRVGNVQSWRLTYTDLKSEVAIGLYRLVEAHGVGGMSAVAGSTAIDWLRTADALKNVTTGGSGWTLNGSQAGDHYVAFQKAQRQCIAFVRNGPAVGGQINWILGAAFCRAVGIAHTQQRAAVHRRCRPGERLGAPGNHPRRRDLRTTAVEPPDALSR